MFENKSDSLPSSLPCLIRSKDFAPIVIELEQWPNKNATPVLARKGLKRDMMPRWILGGQSYSTERHGLCFTREAVQQGIARYCKAVGLEWTDLKAEALAVILDRNIFWPNGEDILKIQDLGNVEEVALAMKRVQAKKRCELVKRKTPAQKFKLLFNPMIPFKDVELSRSKLSDHLAPLNTLLKGYVVGVDVEWLERKPNSILEVGLCHIRNGDLVTEHFIIEEHEALINGQQVPNNKHLLMFGDTERLSLKEAAERVNAAINQADAVFGHAPHNDFKTLHLGEDQINKLKVLDTRLFHKKIMAAIGGSKNEKSALSTIAPFYLGQSIEDTPFHNGGNDIEITGRILLQQAKLSWVESHYLGFAQYATQYKAAGLKTAAENINRGEIAFKNYLKASKLDTCNSIEAMITRSPLKTLDALRLAKKIHCIASKGQYSKLIDFGLMQWQEKSQFSSLEQGIIDDAKVHIAVILKDKQSIKPDGLSKEWIAIALESAWGKKNISRQDNDRLVDLLYQFEPESSVMAM